MRIKKKDTEDFKPDESSVLSHYLKKGTDFSISILRIEGTHENRSDAELAYYVLEGEGVMHLGNEIIELEEESVVYAGKQEHVLEGEMKLLAVRSPPAENPDQEL